MVDKNVILINMYILDWYRVLVVHCPVCLADTILYSVLALLEVYFPPLTVGINRENNYNYKTYFSFGTGDIMLILRDCNTGLCG